jgi:hypothetical protein
VLPSSSAGYFSRYLPCSQKSSSLYIVPAGNGKVLEL